MNRVLNLWTYGLIVVLCAVLAWQAWEADKPAPPCDAPEAPGAPEPFPAQFAAGRFWHASSYDESCVIKAQPFKELDEAGDFQQLYIRQCATAFWARPEGTKVPLK